MRHGTLHIYEVCLVGYLLCYPSDYSVALAQPMSMRFIIRGRKDGTSCKTQASLLGSPRSYCGSRTHHSREVISHMSFLYSSGLPIAILMTATLVPLLSTDLELNIAHRVFKILFRRADPASISLVHKDCRAGSGVHNPDQRRVLAVAPFHAESRYRERWPEYVPYS